MNSVELVNERTIAPATIKQLDVLRLSRQPYDVVWDLQKELVLKRQRQQIPDVLILVEHDPVYTVGKNGEDNHLLQSRRFDVPVYHVERGGDVTFHGPGQIVGYPILDLRDHRKSVSWYMRCLEDVLIRTLMQFGIDSHRIEGLTGVWVGESKIAALGVRLSRWVTMHGFALNVNTDLSYYDGIIPCGIFEYGVTSMKEVLGYKLDMNAVIDEMADIFNRVFGYNINDKFRSYA